MEKTATLNLRVNPDVKRRAEEVLNVLGIPMSTAIDIYLNQIGLTGGIPFAIKIPGAPDSITVENLSAEELRTKLRRGYYDAENGNYVDAQTAFEEFRRRHEE